MQIPHKSKPAIVPLESHAKITLMPWKKNLEKHLALTVLLLKLDSHSGMSFEVKTFLYYSISAYKLPMTCLHHGRS